MSFIKNKKESKLIEGLIEAELEPFRDNRGDIWTLYDQDDWSLEFVEDKISISKKNVLRGLHGDSLVCKLIGCLNGSLFLAVADARKSSSTYGNVQTFVLDEKIPKSILVPAGCLNGHLSLSKQCVFWYKWSSHYDGPENQTTVKWNDEDLNIDWPCKEPILSERDKNGVLFKGIEL